MIYGTQWCASNYPIYLSERSGYLAVRDFCACPIHCRVHWRVGRRLSSCRLISVRPLRSIFARFPERLLKDLVSLGSPGACSMLDRVLGDAFGVLSWSVLEYCSTMWCSAIDTHLKLLDRAVSGARFLSGGVFECDIAHRRSVAVLGMLYKIRFNLVHPLNGALPGPYVPVRVTRGALAEHQNFLALSVSLWNDLGNPVFDGVVLAGFKSRANAFLSANACSIPIIVFYYFFLSLLSVCRLVLWGWGLRTYRVYYGVYHSLIAWHCRLFLIIIIIIVSW